MPGKGLEEPLPLLAALVSLDTSGKGSEEPLPLLASLDTSGTGLEEPSSLEFSQYLELFLNSSCRDEKRRNQTVLDDVFQAWYACSHGSFSKRVTCRHRHK